MEGLVFFGSLFSLLPIVVLLVVLVVVALRQDDDVTDDRAPAFYGAVVLCVLLQLASVYVSLLATVLRVVQPDLQEWLVIVVCSAVPAVVARCIAHGPFRSATAHSRPAVVRFRSHSLPSVGAA